MSAQRAGIVWNPSKVTKEELSSALGESAELSWHETTEDDPGYGAARAAVEAGAQVVLAAGGDGTVRAVAEYLAEANSAVELAVIPLGTGNLLARNLGIPLNNLAAACERAFAGESQPLDIGWVEVRLADRTERAAFAVMAGFGIDAHMITETNDDLKDRAGWLAYVESLGRALDASEVIDVRLSIDEADAKSEAAHTLIIGNCGTLQGGITLLPDADPGDGELDLLVLSADSFAAWADTARNLIWDNGLKRLFVGNNAEAAAQSSDSASHRRFSTLVMELAEPRVFEVDGDVIGESTHVSVSIQAAAVRVR